MNFTFQINKFYITCLILFQFIFAGTTGKISGKVVDENNQPLIGCNIIVKGTVLQSTTQSHNSFVSVKQVEVWSVKCEVPFS